MARTVDLNVDDNNQPLTCEDYYRDGYTFEAFLATYDPEVWGRVVPSGPLEAAPLTSRNAQQSRVRIRIGSNTTIVRLDKHATIRGAWFDIRSSSSANRTNIPESAYKTFNIIQPMRRNHGRYECKSKLF